MINCILTRMIWKTISVHWFCSSRSTRLLRLTRATLILDVWLFMPAFAIPIGHVIWRMVVLSMEEINSVRVRTTHSNKVNKIGAIWHVIQACVYREGNEYFIARCRNIMIYDFHIKLLSEYMHSFKNLIL